MTFGAAPCKAHTVCRVNSSMHFKDFVLLQQIIKKKITYENSCYLLAK